MTAPAPHPPPAGRLDEKAYLDRMVPWLSVLPGFLRRSVHNPALRYYGTGESLHWPTQSNLNVFAALAVMASSPVLPEQSIPLSRQEILETALALLRYALATHLTGDAPASDGRSWGHHWISVLGLERMAHGLDAIRDHLTDEDRNAVRRVLISECDWRLDACEVVAGLVGADGKNKPESNIWNGGVLLRTAMEYPDAPRAPAYLEKATRFLLNGLSCPADAADETVFHGKPVRDWHAGANFTPAWSLDHHGYLNVGYMVICLSNLAMLHFFFKRRSLVPPPELYWHVRDLWRQVKMLTFADGRLLRVGGDTRARYTYCQNYAIPAWLLAEDFLQDADAASFERGWLAIVGQETAYTGNGGFYGRRLDAIRKSSYFYYARLESDALVALSYGAYWRRLFDLPQPPAATPVNPPAAWEEPFHGATLDRSGSAVRAFVWHGAQGPTGLLAPADASDLAEWQGNLHGRLVTAQNAQLTQGVRHWQTLFPGGFLNAGLARWRDLAPLGEGELPCDFADHQIAVAALPDGRTLLVLEYARTTFEVSLLAVTGYGILIPNDLFNGLKRRYTTPDGRSLETASCPDRETVVPLGTDRVGIDGRLAVWAIAGADQGLVLHRPAARSIVIRKNSGPWLGSLYADTLCGTLALGHQRVRPGTVLLDGAFAIGLYRDLAGPQVRAWPQPGLLRAVSFREAGQTFLFAANFGAAEAAPRLPDPHARRIAGPAVLPPGAAALWLN